LLDQRPKDFPKAIDKAGDGAAAIRKEPDGGRNESSYPGTKTAIDGCPLAGGRDEIHKEYASLAARHSPADHPSDRAFPSSRLIAWAWQGRPTFELPIHSNSSHLQRVSPQRV
jgi:hypothetical protein